MMKKILVTAWMPDDVLRAYRGEFDIVMPTREQLRFNRYVAEERIAEFDGMLTVWTPISASMMDAGVRLRAVATPSVGYDHIDVAHAASKGIAVLHAPTTVTAPTSELTLALIIDVARRVSWFDRRTRAMCNTKNPLFDSDLVDRCATPTGKTLGIVGFGRIGREVARKARTALGMKIIYYSRSAAPADVEQSLGARRVSFDELLAEADFISAHCPYTESTHHLFGAEAFAKMKPSAYFINMARGKVMDEAALVSALSAGQIAGAALDVYENEPSVSPELASMENVVIVPHIGTFTRENLTAMIHEAMDGLTAVLAGRDAPNIVRLAR